MAITDERPELIMRARGLAAASDSGELELLARGVIDANAGQLAKYRAGEVKVDQTSPPSDVSLAFSGSTPFVS